MKPTIIFISVITIIGLFLLTACHKEEEEKEKKEGEKGVFYHKAMGEGYVFYKDSKKPVAYANIGVIGKRWTARADTEELKN